MNVYMTTGTYEFMKKMREKHADETMVLMQGENTTLLLHETDGKSLFQTPAAMKWSMAPASSVKKDFSL